MFKGILKEQTIQVGIGFVFIVVLLGGSSKPKGAVKAKSTCT
jgi:hypothetical protein